MKRPEITSTLHGVRLLSAGRLADDPGALTASLLRNGANRQHAISSMVATWRRAVHPRIVVPEVRHED